MPGPRAVISGVGASPQGKLPGSTPLSLATVALKAALSDAGLTKDDLDGLLTMPGTTSPEGPKHYLSLGGNLGLNPRITGSMSQGGATAGVLVQQAALAVDAGLASAVACVFSDTARTGGSRFDAAAGRGDSWGIWGMFGNAANSAFTATRHMAQYGTTTEQLGWVAVTCRRHASMNPSAVMRDPISLEDHATSRAIVDPLRKLDCCLISDGAVAIIVTSPERARDSAKPPVRLLGIGQGHTLQTFEHPEWWYLPHQRDCISQAYRMAGLSPDDVDVAQLYDNFTISVLLWLEHAGFCAPGDAGPFVEGGERITHGGRLPINTAGGNLSESYMQGWLHVVEGVRQIRGECGDRQVEDAEVCLVTGRGMTLNTASCLLLGKT
ncbi:MAG TPA: thiolase family protein [Solirubrobacteraceae bacterium]|jgi:acetyl-CoA acetyltransferase|nr:thiolase family protein [Solirubrobacteraceae bacterium]